MAQVHSTPLLVNIGVVNRKEASPGPPKEKEMNYRPCPFCAGEEMELCQIYNTSVWVVSCKSCSASGPIEETKKEAIKSWNKRY